MNKKDTSLCIGFLAIIVSLFLLLLISPVKSFSDTENRVLQGMPEISLQRIVSKQFTKQMETFIADQFPFRDQWVAVKSSLQQLRGQKENNGIYKGSDGYLLEKFQKPDFVKIQKYLDAINKMAVNNEKVNITFLLAPTSVGIYPEKLPAFAGVFPQSEINRMVGDRLADLITYIDGFDFLSSTSPELLYYKTDHHWTTYSAYLAYREFCERQGWAGRPLEEFNIETVSNSFLGSYHTRSQFTGIDPDAIQVYLPKNAPEMSLYIADKAGTYQSWYFAEFLHKKDQYAYFQGGVHSLMQISSKLDKDAVKQEKLLVIKDSYSHSVLPFLALDIPFIDVIDIRFYNGSIRQYIEDNGITDVLLLFNTSTFVESQDMIKLQY